MTRLLVLAPLLSLVACLSDEDAGKGGDGCHVVSTDVITLDTPMDGGFTPRQVLAFAEGDHSATLAWTAGGTTALTAGVTATGGDVRRSVTGGTTDTGGVCDGETLAIDVVLDFSTADGAFAESRPAVLTGTADFARTRVTWTQAEQVGTWRAEDSDDALEIDVSANASFDATGTYGDLSAVVVRDEGEGVHSSSDDSVGRW